MRAVRLHQFGDPSGLRCEEVVMPRAGEGEVVVRVAAASVNPSDVKNVQGHMHQTTLPRTPGRDFAGTVAQGRKDLVGVQVWGTGGDIGFTRDGSHAEYLLLPAAAVVKRPERLTVQQAGCSGLTFLTAAYGLREAGLAAGLAVVVIGAYGGVGRAAMQIAQSRGAHAIGIAISDPPADLPQTFAGMSLLNSKKQDVEQEVRKLTGGRGADIVYDTVGGSMFVQALKYLANRGRIIEISPGRDPKVTFNIRDFYHQEARLIGIDTLSLDASQSAAILNELLGGIVSGELAPPPIAATYALEDAPRAYAAVEKDGGGRHVLTPSQH